METDTLFRNYLCMNRSCADRKDKSHEYLIITTYDKENRARNVFENVPETNRNRNAWKTNTETVNRSEN